MEIGIFNESNLPDEIAFDHRSILSDLFELPSHRVFDILSQPD